MEKKPLESDWKLFRMRVPEWLERYLSVKNMEIVGVLSDDWNGIREEPLPCRESAYLL